MLSEYETPGRLAYPHPPDYNGHRLRSRWGDDRPMPIPDYQSIMLPLLRLSSDGEEHRFWNAVDQLAAGFELTDEERSEMLPSDASPRFDNRVGWAKIYLKQARLLKSPKMYLKVTKPARAYSSLHQAFHKGPRSLQDASTQR